MNAWQWLIILNDGYKPVINHSQPFSTKQWWLPKFTMVDNDQHNRNWTLCACRTSRFCRSMDCRGYSTAGMMGLFHITAGDSRWQPLLTCDHVGCMMTWLGSSLGNLDQRVEVMWANCHSRFTRSISKWMAEATTHRGQGGAEIGCVSHVVLPNVASAMSPADVQCFFPLSFATGRFCMVLSFSFGHEGNNLLLGITELNAKTNRNNF